MCPFRTYKYVLSNINCSFSVRTPSIRSLNLVDTNLSITYMDGGGESIEANADSAMLLYQAILNDLINLLT